MTSLAYHFATTDSWRRPSSYRTQLYTTHNYFLRVFYHDFIIRYQLRDQIPNLIVYFSAMTRPYLRSLISFFIFSSLIAGYFLLLLFFLYLRDQLFGIYSRFFSSLLFFFYASLFWHVTIFLNFSFTLDWKFSFYSIKHFSINV